MTGALVDATAAYPVIGALLGTVSWLQAERIVQRRLTKGRGLARFVRSLEDIDAERLLREPEVWTSLAGLALIEPDGDPIAVRGRVLGTVEDHTTTAYVADGSVPVWCGVPRVIAAKLRTGRMPKILEAYIFSRVGIVAGARPVWLPGGIVFDPRLSSARKGRRFRDFAIALAEIGLLAKARTLEGFTADQMKRMQGGIKIARNVAAYGGPVEFNPSVTAHSAWTPDGKLENAIHEEPGWLTDPVAGSLVVAGCELLLSLLEVLIEHGGGSTSFVDTDAAFVQTSSDGQPQTLPGPNGYTVGTLTPEALAKILNRFEPIARSTGLSIPEQVVETTDGRSFTIFDGMVGPWFLPPFVAHTGLDVVHYAILMPSIEMCVERVLARKDHGFRDEPATRDMYGAFLEADIDAKHTIADMPDGPSAVATEILTRFHTGALAYSTCP